LEVAEDVDQIMAFLKQTEPTNAKTNEEKKENSNENGKENGKSEDLVSTQKGGRGRRGRKKKIKKPPSKTINPQKEVKSKPSEEKSAQVEKTQDPKNITNEKELQSENVNVPVVVQPQQPTKVRFGKFSSGGN
jgi:hypothetical protein